MSRRQALAIGLGYLAFAVMAMPETALGVAWPAMQQSFGVSLDALGVLLITSRVGLIGAGIFGGRLSARWGMGLFLAVGCFLRALTLLGYMVAPTWGVLLAVSIVAGLGGGMLATGLNAYFALRHGPRLMNWLHASFGLGAMLGPVVMTAGFSMGMSWRWGYGVFVLLQVLIGVGLVLTASQWSRAAPQAETAGSATGGRLSTWRLLRQPIFWLSLALFFVSAGVEASTGQWSFTLLTESRGLAVTVAGTVVSIFWLAFTGARLLFGVVADRIAPEKAIAVCIAGATGAGLLFALDLGSWVTVAALTGLGVALAPLAPLLTSTTPDRVGAERATEMVGYQVGAASIGVAFMPALAGVLAERIALEAIGPFLVAGCLILWGLTVWTARARTVQ